MNVAQNKNQLLDEPTELRKDIKIILAVLIILSSMSALDLLTDYFSGAPLTHLYGEMSLTLLSIGVIALIWYRSFQRWHKLTANLKASIASVREQAKQWQDEAAHFTKGLTQAIDQQYSSWGLSPAEKDIASLLIKGLSFKEVAQLRETNERTVRQQAAAIYAKAGLEGRAQLAAYFLEDLLPEGSRQ